MKKQLLQLTFLLMGILAFGQTPVIEGDVMLCPYDNGTASITSGGTYDTYQWYYKYWFLQDDFEPIEGATEASFTYDWYTYDQALLKVVVTSGDQTYQSNTIQIDSWNWTGMLVFIEEGDNITFDPETLGYKLCEGTDMIVSVNNPPYSANIQWTKDDEPIPGANQASYTITEAGVYRVKAAPQMCPNSINTSSPIFVEIDSDCELSTGDHNKNAFLFFPNPAKEQLTIQADTSVFNQYFVFDLTGKLISKGSLSQTEQVVSLAGLDSGIYLVTLKGATAVATQKVVKE